jgi:hypothetical protein
MRLVCEIGGIILLINGIGGLINDDFGLLSRLTDGAGLTGLQFAAVVVGGVMLGGSLISRSRS